MNFEGISGLYSSDRLESKRSGFFPRGIWDSTPSPRDYFVTSLHPRIASSGEGSN